MSTKGLQLASFILPGKSLYPPLVILHGLFGSKQNWQSISKRLSQKIEYPLHVLDLRNHGESPHHEEMTYELMAKDVDTYLHSHSLQNPILIGHSMGGKVALATAKLHPSSIRGVISIDMSPLEGPISPLFQRYIQAMLELEKAKPKRLLDANVFLEKPYMHCFPNFFLLYNFLGPLI
ncbi:hypothetical protein HMI56_002310 [Coelomomyces lativittatus]|nr:hypothetical protein HMI56_002310 [Coelomomyces lativittatus]